MRIIAIKVFIFLTVLCHFSAMANDEYQVQLSNLKIDFSKLESINPGDDLMLVFEISDKFDQKFKFTVSENGKISKKLPIVSSPHPFSDNYVRLFRDYPGFLNRFISGCKMDETKGICTDYDGDPIKFQFETIQNTGK